MPGGKAQNVTRVLAGSGVTVREAGPPDAVGGVLPGWVALPETVEEVSALLRACAEAGLATVAVGGGTKLDWGAPPERCDVLIDTCCLNEVIEYTPGDLVVRVQAGVTLEALAALLAEQGQELVCDGPYGDAATIGGMLATGAAGPRAFRYGTPRDLLIGITVVLADGTIAKSGGRVVKNVAGYDLGKLFTGSYGTLGVIAEAAFRLHPVPAARAWVLARLSRDAVQQAAVRLAASQAEPAAVEVDWPDPPGPVTLAALVEGSAAGQRARALAALLGEGAEITGEQPEWWGEPAGREGLAEVRCLPARVTRVLATVDAQAGLSLRGSPAAGRFWLEGAGEGFGAAVAGLRETGARVSVLAAPYDLGLDKIDRWGEVSALPLMRRVKEQFDPGRRMSPGRFVGGI
ncbi:FAD-binding oxidoreductase [Nonomuraea typhae]|uniref:FAD-binding oxidoreductase n=1 Tax=Nonomuraea typhae TaxID=2603600 RepID=A0ABW7YRA3_9ACTN